MPRRDEPCTAPDSYIFAACCVIACVTGVVARSFCRQPARREAAEDGPCHELHLVNYSGMADGLCSHAGGWYVPAGSTSPQKSMRLGPCGH